MPTYLDCGANLGQGYEIMRDRFKMDDLWKIVLIEPNVRCNYDIMEKCPSTATIINAALDTSSKKTTLNIAYCTKENDLVGGETNILPAGYYNWEEYFKHYNEKTNHFGCEDIVDTIPLHSVIKDLDLEDIYIKMDIEGMEFNVLEQFIQTQELSRVRFIAIEWHERFFGYNKAMSDKRNMIEEKFSETPNLKYEVWH